MNDSFFGKQVRSNRATCNMVKYRVKSSIRNILWVLHYNVKCLDVHLVTMAQESDEDGDIQKKG